MGSEPKLTPFTKILQDPAFDIFPQGAQSKSTNYCLKRQGKLCTANRMYQYSFKEPQSSVWGIYSSLITR